MLGLYFEQFELGQTFKHDMRRTVTENDDVIFSTMTHNPAAIHVEVESSGIPTQSMDSWLESISRTSIFADGIAYGNAGLRRASFWRARLLKKRIGWISQGLHGQP